MNATSLCNPALERMRAGEPALGMVVRLGRTGDIARIAKSTGHDFVFIDVQHALYTVETVGQIAQAALGCGVTAIARVRGAHDPDMGRLLDNGVGGIVVPDVETAEDARAAVAACKFVPIGKRGVSGSYPMFDFASRPLKDALHILNENTLLACMIETVKGLDNIEAIAAVEGVDVLHLGCNDLLVDMGKPGAFGDPAMIAAVERVLKVCRANGKFAGLGGDRDIDRQARFIREGLRFVTTQTDVAFLMAEAARRTQTLRDAVIAVKA